MPYKIYYWSLDDESFTGEEFDTVAEALADAFEEEPEATSVFVGERREPVFDLRFLDGQRVIERVKDDSEDFWIDVAQDWPELQGFEVADLTAKLRTAFNAWIEEHKLQPTHFVIEDVRSYTREDFEAGRIVEPAEVKA